ncbi:MAG: tRNA (adenosine(37)-N6)-dimethylallyltransferase MiaA [Candidatus Dormibacteraeota bacterium]|nr:tRNA (adenosine(37)-N6)-dimethylallyltransferase MiaA [Candidatus Dormibacteraeota bacterium]
MIVIVGPTCTGKTRLAVALARKLWPAELLNADSRQLRRGLRAGTCAPTQEEVGEVPCHLLDLADPGQEFTVAGWLEAARRALEVVEARDAQPIVVGGTGLYVTALVEGYDFGGAPPDPATRSQRTRIAETAAGRDQLAAELTSREPSAAGRVDLRNPRRVIRALEILDATGRLQDGRGSRPRAAVIIGVDAPRELHEAWVRHRSEVMFRSGAILDEARAALAGGYGAPAIAGCGIGYAEALAVLEGAMTVDDAVAATTQRTLRYARSQRTYFRRDKRITWLHRSGPEADLIAAAMDAVAGGELSAQSV